MDGPVRWRRSHSERCDRLKRRALALTAAALMLAATAADRPVFAGYAAIVVDAQSGRVLHFANPDRLNYPASLTKMMTLYLVFDALAAGRASLGDSLAVSATAAARPASKLGLEEGDTIRLETAIQALATKSANDVATVIAEHFAVNERRFAMLMTRQARQLGMARTTFRNASGLPDPEQRTTARDISRLARALYRDFPQYTHYFSRTSFRYNGVRYANTNRLLGRYPGMNGIKTGYIRASGFNLAASVRRGERHIIAVVMGGRTGGRRNAQMRRILDRAFADVDGILRVLATVARPKPKPDSRLVMTAVALPAAAVISAPLPALGAPGRGWAIQVGAYSRRDTAESALDAAAGVVPSLGTGGARLIMPVEDANGTLFRARQLGLTKDEAQRACAALWQRSLPCMVWRPFS